MGEIVIPKGRQADAKCDVLRLSDSGTAKLLELMMTNEKWFQQAGPAYPPQGVGSADP